ncbi:MAG: hypothetical protein BMS9Abin37_2284 [Acidobacteriota bacterium]|nr:MAG: hypothetical protein BMS9Abin37_2284 [Acidobacteriota bacterium]
MRSVRPKHPRSTPSQAHCLSGCLFPLPAPPVTFFDKYLETQERIKSNQMYQPNASAKPGAAREGKALLQGLVRCGRCGRQEELFEQKTNNIIKEA